jgi:hypothetical protein
MAEEIQFLNKNRFTKMIEATVSDLKISYMDAVIHLCEKNDIELEDVNRFVSPIIKGKIEAEAMGLNFLPSTNSLDSAFFE